MNKNNLQLLLDELQKERDFLEAEIQKCIDDRDFDGAAWFDKSLNFTKHQLRIFKKLAEPYYHELRDLEGKLSMLEFRKSRLPESVDHDQLDREISETKMLLEQYRTNSKEYLDHDELIIRIDQLLKQEIESLVLSIVDNEIEIRIDANGEDNIMITLKTIKGKSLFDYTYHYGRSLLWQLGFRIQSEDQALMTGQVYEASPLKVLEVLSILALEIFPPYREKFAFLRVSE